jgi:hypothetical protein
MSAARDAGDKACFQAIEGGANARIFGNQALKPSIRI